VRGLKLKIKGAAASQCDQQKSLGQKKGKGGAAISRYVGAAIREKRTKGGGKKVLPHTVLTLTKIPIGGGENKCRWGNGLNAKGDQIKGTRKNKLVKKTPKKKRGTL